MAKQTSKINADAFQLTEFLPYQLSIAANTVSAHIAKTYAPYQLSRTQWRVMAVLSGGSDMSAQQVADKTGMDKTTISRAVGKMLERGLLKRTQSPQDARAVVLSLSCAGADMFAQIIPSALAQEEKIRAQFTAQELVVLSKFLNKLNGVVSL